MKAVCHGCFLGFFRNSLLSPSAYSSLDLVQEKNFAILILLIQGHDTSLHLFSSLISFNEVLEFSSLKTYTSFYVILLSILFFHTFGILKNCIFFFAGV